MNIRNIHLLAGLVSAAGLVSLAAGCELIVAVDRDTIPSSTGGGGTGGEGGVGGHGHGGAGGAGGTGGQGGAGGGPECMTSVDCAVPGNECVTASCTNGTCGTENVATGTPVTTQMAGDCKVVVCDGMGGTTTVSLDSDVEDDGKSCTTDTCDAGTSVHTPVTAGEACSEGTGKFCDGNGACVECTQNADCMTGVCQAGSCMAAPCGDGMQGGDETDVDCGGSCGPCADGLTCISSTDCTSKVCTNGACAAATCSDGMKNQGESDVDCGGANCAKCNTGQTCTINVDCLGGSCSMGTCAPTCMDMMQNQGESDVDCGGPSCPNCADGLMCAGSDDCQSMFCNPDTMLCAGPTCSDGFQNGSETDVDCGGSCVNDCADGDKCLASGDCTSGFCNPMSGTCAAPSCSDGSQNGGETGVDCGGPDCGACAGESCMTDTACASSMCYEGACVAQVNGCDVATAQDLTAQSAVTVTFANGNLSYAPRCIKVKVGTSITLNGNFGFHPTIGGVVVNNTPTPASSGPFAQVTSTGNTKTYAMSQAGTFPYYCQPHATQGMTAAVFVVP